jgi:hypothetical protein
MKKSIKVQLNLLVPEHERDLLRKIAATKILNNPSKTYSAAGIGAKIISEYLSQLTAGEENTN